jgi:hypothetical protein
MSDNIEVLLSKYKTINYSKSAPPCAGRWRGSVRRLKLLVNR